MHKDPRAIGTDLPRGIEIRQNRRADGVVKIGILEHDQRRFAAQFHRDVAHPFGGGGIDAAPGRHRPGQRHLGDMRIGHQRRTHRAAPLHHVENARRQARIAQDLGQFQRAERGFLAGLEDHRIAHGQRRRGLPAGDLAGIVPRPDPGADAQRLTHGIGPILAQRDMLAGDAGGQPAKEFQRIGTRGPVGHAGFLNRLAGIERFQLGQFLGPLADDRGGAGQHPAAFGQCHRGPAGLRGLGRGAGLRDLIRACLMQFGNGAAVIGKQHRQDRAFALDRGAVDPQAGGGLGSQSHVSSLFR